MKNINRVLASITVGLAFVFPTISASVSSLNSTSTAPSPTVRMDLNGRAPSLEEHYQLESSGTANIHEFGSGSVNLNLFFRHF